MKHLKRQKTPLLWPIPRKGNTWVVRPKGNLKTGIPLLVVLRDILKLTQNRKELKKALHEKKIIVNDKIAKDERETLLLFDKISIIPLNKFYRINLSEKGKFEIKEIKETESHSKTAKIINKKVLKKKKIQWNLSDGRNILSEEKCNVGDSVVLNFKDKKIEKIIPLKEKTKTIIFSGKHTGTRGIIVKFDEKNKMAEIDTKDKKINVLIKQIMGID